MNHKKAYEKLIISRRSLNRKKEDGTFESHHIIPKCFGGSNKRENRVLLTPKEHFIAHLLLTECYKGLQRRSMVYGLSQMMRSNKHQHRIHSASRYDMVRRLESEVRKGVSPTEEQKRKISESLKGRVGVTRGRKLSAEHCRKIGISKTGRIKTQEEIEKIRKAAIGRKMPPITEEARVNMSLAAQRRCSTQEYRDRVSPILRTTNTGKEFSEETKLRMSAARKKWWEKKV